MCLERIWRKKIWHQPLKCIMGDVPISISYYCKTYLKWECIGQQQKKKKLIQKPLWRYPHIPISPPLCQILVKVSKCPDFVIDSYPFQLLCSLGVQHISNMSKLSPLAWNWNFQNISWCTSQSFTFSTPKEVNTKLEIDHILQCNNYTY